jgi:hypothetical protein
MQETLDIVGLIENNPISRLSSTYNSKLLIKIKEAFSNFEQQLFVSSFYCYLNYDKTKDFVVDLNNVWKWIGFSQKVSAERMLETNFKLAIDYNKLAPHFGGASSSDQKQNGGQNKQIVMMTIKCFKSLCLKAQTKKATEIHDYYLKLEEVLHDIADEETSELRKELQIKDQQIQQQQEESKAEIERIENAHKKDHSRQMAIAKEQVLLKEYGTSGSLVYIIKVKTHKTSAYVIKIGESRIGIQARYDDHRSNYEECILLDCFPVLKSKEFEKFIHEHDNIRTERVTDLEGHERERELFLIGHRLSYNALTKIIKTNIKSYNEYSNKESETIRNENESLREELALFKSQKYTAPQIENSIISELVESNKQLHAMIGTLLERFNLLECTLNKTNSIPIVKTTTNFGIVKPTLGPRLQCIHPDTLQLVKVYESATECMTENDKIKRPSLTKAAQDNTAYHGFRWMFVDRELDARIVSPNIQPTKPVHVQNLGYIAKLTPDKSEILNVYIDRKTAAINNGYSASALDVPVKNGTPLNNYYYQLYDKCDEELTNAFASNKNGGNDPILFKNGLGQYDEKHALIKEFVCKYDCIRMLKMSDKTLQKAIDGGTQYNGFYYKMLGERLWL